MLHRNMAWLLDNIAWNLEHGNVAGAEDAMSPDPEVKALQSEPSH